MEKRVLLKDIAAKVGVSIALVSYVLNNKEGRVGRKMAEKIRKVAADMNYLPNLVAKSLQSGRTHTIGLLVADISNAFFSRIARIIELEAEKSGYTVIFGSTDESADKSRLLIEAFLNRQVDGLIIAPVAATSDQLLMLKKKKVPFVLIDRYFSALDVNSVRVNNYESAYNATEYLIQTGRKRISLISYKDTGMSHFSERSAGYKAALKKYRRRANLISVPYRQMEKEMPAVLKQLIMKDA
ncbi:MAG: LacI family DNA-binding transcriptional regulator, partial [Chitinophagaceae bacterium]|nr:LacI family DNA-binding transcriptional regulator [Chitinophagaceae bacterium]